jgi:hypothetical protein
MHGNKHIKIQNIVVARLYHRSSRITQIPRQLINAYDSDVTRHSFITSHHKDCTRVAPYYVTVKKQKAIIMYACAFCPDVLAHKSHECDAMVYVINGISCT